MKRKIICLFMVCVFGAVTLQPSDSARAAKLWNSQTDRAGDSEKGKRRIYSPNKTKGSQKRTLYNRKGQGRAVISNSRSSRELNSIEAYKRVKMAGQKPSKLWKFMDSSAASNRQSDIDMALQQEYNINKKAAVTMINALKIRGQERALNARKDKARLAKYKADQAAKKRYRLEIRSKAIEKAEKIAKRQSRGKKKSEADELAAKLYNPYLSEEGLNKPGKSFKKY